MFILNSSESNQEDIYFCDKDQKTRINQETKQ